MASHDAAPRLVPAGAGSAGAEQPGLLALPDMALVRVLEMLAPPPRAALGCVAHAAAMRDAAALSHACRRLRGLYAEGTVRAYRVCPSCAFLARGADLMRIAQLLRTARVVAMELGQIGWARHGLRDLLHNMATHGQWLRVVDLSGVECGDSDALQRMLQALAANGRIEDLRLWVGGKGALQAVHRSGIITVVESLILSGVRHSLDVDDRRALRMALIHAESSRNSLGMPCPGYVGSSPSSGLRNFGLLCQEPHKERPNNNGNHPSDSDSSDMDVFHDQVDQGNENESLHGGSVAEFIVQDESVMPIQAPKRLGSIVAEGLPQGLEEIRLGIPTSVRSLIRAARLRPNCMASLRDVHFANSRDVTGARVAALVASLPALHSVALRRCPVEPQSLRQILVSLGPLLVEFVECCVWRAGNELECARQRCPNLRRLSISCAVEEAFALPFEGQALQVFDRHVSQPLDGPVIALCKALSSRLVELQIDDTALSDSALQEAVAAASGLESLTVRWTKQPNIRYDYWMLRNKSRLRSLKMHPIQGQSWCWSALGINNVMLYCRQYCGNLEEFGLVTPTLRNGKKSERVWRALDKLVANCPLVCTALARSKLYHPYGHGALKSVYE